MENYLKLFKDNEEYLSFDDKPKMGHLVDDTDLKQTFIINYTATAKLSETQNLINGFNTPLIGQSFNNGIGKLYFNKKVTTINVGAFSGITSLTGIEIPNSVTTIKEYAFKGCNKLEYIRIPDHITNIPRSCFQSCSKLKRMNSDVDGVINLPTKLQRVEIEAFVYSLSGGTPINVNMPYGLNTISQGAFAYCCSVLSWDIPESVTTIGDAAFAQCTGLTSVTWPSTVEVIGEQTFRDCKSLESVVIPEGVRIIESRAFGPVTLSTSSLKYIELPSTIEYLEFGVFRDYGTVNDAVVIIHAETPPELDDYDTRNIFPENSKIYVPANSVQEYKSQILWYSYRNRIYPIE